MPFIKHPHVADEHIVVERGKIVLVAHTTVELDCCQAQFDGEARAMIEGQQASVASYYGFDEVRIVQV